MSSAACSYSSLEKESLLEPESFSKGAQRVKYVPHEDWDYVLEAPFKPIDISLLLPNHRARNQPNEHRMNMFVAGNTEPIKIKVCRQMCRFKFFLEVQATSAEVVVWLPSDFRGHISHSGKASFSAGFTNRIMSYARFNEYLDGEEDITEDEVVVHTHGKITFRMWDVTTGAPENANKEKFKRMFGCGQKAPETTIDWDFLLE